MSRDVTVEEHEYGYALDGTPADCTVAGLEVLCPDVDMVVAGCNKGANIGAYTLGRSGTVSAAVEAAFFEVPAMAVSLYVPAMKDWESVATTVEDYRNPVDITTFLAEHAIDAGVYEQADYLNINAPYSPPAADEHLPVEITRPSRLHDMRGERTGDEIHLRDAIWERMAADTVPEPDGTDRWAVMEGRISVSPLTAPHTTEHHDGLVELLETYGNG